MSMREEIVFVGTSDLSGHYRGKSFPAQELPSKLQRGIGQSPTNLYMGAFGPIQTTTFGTRGEVFLVPDPTTRVYLSGDGEPAEHYYLGDFFDLDGQPWAYCPRGTLRRALADLEHETGWRLYATFEQEFTYTGVPATPWRPYELDGLRRQGFFGTDLLARLREAGITPDSFLAEYGPRQFEVTTAPVVGLRAADEAVIVREILKMVAYRHGHSVSLAPMGDPHGVANGTHVHFSFLGPDDRPAMYDPSGEFQLSPAAAAFVAGVLRAMPALCALSTPSVASYYRLRPNRWAPVSADIGDLDRATALRIAPTPAQRPEDRARQYNVEFRVADATANPYLALTGLVRAGLDGVRHSARLQDHRPMPLPTSLDEALDHLARVPDEWLGAPLRDGYIQFKRAEADALRGLDETEICARYGAVY
jgi:glutamine synthetase